MKRSPCFLRRFPRGIACSSVVFICLASAGCGFDEYERRLKATEDYYAYQDRIERNLATPWRTPPVDSLRVPLQFTEIPAPPAVEVAEGESPPPDSRQPDYASMTIHGLIGAWRANVDAQGAEHRESKPVYLYVATNHQILLRDKTEALGFLKSILLPSLESESEVAVSQGVVSFPKGHQFVTRQDFENYVITRENFIDGARYLLDVYTTQQAENQVAIILIRPEGMDPMSKIQDRLQLTLETLRVSAAAPQPRQAGGQQPASSAPAGGSF